jgi:hypothetical protein
VEGDALDEAGEDLGWRAGPGCLRHHGMMAIKILGRHRDQAGTVWQAPLATGQKPRRRGAALSSTESALTQVLLLALGIAPEDPRSLGFRGLVSDDQYLVSDGDTVKAIPTCITEPDRDRKSAINGRDRRDALYRAILPFAIS